ncbi:50S ribosomal protein L29 [bacterium]|nr:50S ribosomal protein L29 [bacterium]
MKIKDIRDLSFEELKDRLGDKAEEFANLKFQLALHQLDNTASVRSIRREYARMLTIAKEHELGIRKLSEQESGASN